MDRYSSEMPEVSCGCRISYSLKDPVLPDIGLPVQELLGGIAWEREHHGPSNVTSGQSPVVTPTTL